ncbi:hypothetical protein DV096_04385 [Bradymonadaceae bacterium TMQ3]|nr:hypothetical protein DV096_04385 [Bradymonadaceae bacterium TMQ3]
MAFGAVGAFFLLNPLALGCGDERVEGYTFGADDMAAVVVGEWSGEVTYDAEAVAFTLVIEASPVGAQQTGSLRQHLCGNRTLIASADACIATSQFDVVGEVQVAGQEARQVEGSLVAYGQDLNEGELTLYGAGEVWVVQMIDAALADAGEVRDQDDRALLGRFFLSSSAMSD